MTPPLPPLPPLLLPPLLLPPLLVPLLVPLLLPPALLEVDEDSGASAGIAVAAPALAGVMETAGSFNDFTTGAGPESLDEPLGASA